MNRINLLLCVGVLAALVSCGGSQGSGLVPGEPAAGNDPAGALQAVLPDPSTLSADAGRSLSVAGPGWYTFDLLQRSFGGNEQGVTDDAPAIDIEGTAGSGYSIFGAHGFDGDSYPTGIRADVSDVTGEYYLLYTNYVDGRWRTAGPFTESTTYEYPEVDQYSDPELLTSRYTNHFVAVLVPDGSSLQLDMLQLGVHGGDEGPFPVIAIAEQSNEHMVTIIWLNSPDANDPDFAGYSVERAPFPLGEFTTMTTENTFETFFNDEDAELGVPHIYRVVTWDTAGNSATSMAIPAFRSLGATSDPVCVVEGPRGPLVGPVEVTFDLSGSFDNDGDVLNSFTFDFGSGMGEISQPDPVLTVTLQPGCYFMRFTAKGGGGTGSTFRLLKVYPQWESSSNLIDEGTALAPRYWLARSFYDHVSDKVVFLFSDASTPSLVSLTVDIDGNVERNDIPYTFPDPIAYMSEPVFANGNWQFAVAYPEGLMACIWQDNEIQPNYLATASTDSLHTAMVTDGNGNTWLLYQEQNVGYDITVVSFDTLTEATLVSGLAAPGFMDAEWNPDAEAIDLLYSGNLKTEWLRWSPVIGPIGSFTLSGADSAFIDAEVDPATGRPLALFSDGPNIRYSELNDDDTTWTAPLPVDPIDPDWPFTTLVFRGGEAYCYIGDNPGDSKLYRRNGANWDAINTADFVGGGFFNSMSYNPNVPGFTVIDTATDLVTRITQMQEDGAEQELHTSDGWARYGLELSAASSATEIHLLHKPASNYIHWSSPDGVAWTEKSDAGMGVGGKIVADGNGEIYSSLKDAGNSILRQWVDPAWAIQDILVISPDTLPIIYGQGNALLFGNFNGAAVPDEFYYKENLDPAMVILPQTDAIWDGAFAGINTSNARLLVRYGGSTFDSGDIGYMDKMGEIDKIYEPAFTRFDDPWTMGRHMEGAVYRNNFTSDREVFYIAFGPSATYARVTRNLFSDWEVQEYGLIFSEAEAIQRRNCVSAMTAWGDTAVGLGSDVMGGIRFLEWDNFGNFEDLPIPDGMENDSLHELVVGPDGRWHIIYRDHVNDDLRILSTVN